ncbi:phage tail tape measure protein [Subtercola boreus]|uniref:Phage tail tape measure protein n=1 Tax=Subtercola boreus TaxID=120213 RepID=A0A3E0VRU7_9MICO|nr:phage tail tape measure protein [Subtercola boreus]RFA12168.1 phage tail tape measure protein [Subtercola boreus]
MDSGKIVYQILMQGAAVFKKDAAEADAATKKLGNTAEQSAAKVTKSGGALDKTGAAASKAKAPLEAAAAAEKRVGSEADGASNSAQELGTSIDEAGQKSAGAANGLDAAADSTKKLSEGSDEAAESTKKAAEGAKDLASDTAEAKETIGEAAAAIGAGFAAASILAISKFAEFQSGLSNVDSSTHATAAEMAQLSDAALDAGAKTSFSARGAADAEDELAKAGLSVSDIVGGSLTGSLSLAAAGQLDVARAAEIAATTLKQFNLTGADTEHVADLLAAGAGKAQGSVDDLAQGLKYVGPVTAALGVSLDETVGTLSLFASQGLLADQAGTGLRGVIQSLVSPSIQASKTLAAYNVNLFDSNGKFIGLAGTAQALDDAFGGLDDATRSAALGQIFGNEQITAAQIFYKDGAKAVDDWTSKVNESGYAADTAARKQDNLNSDIEKLGGSLDTALIKTGAAANGPLRDMVQLVSSLIDVYSGLPDVVQGGVLMFGVATAAVLLFGGTLLLAIPKIAEFRGAVALLGSQMPRTVAAMRGLSSFLMGPWGIAIAAAIVGVTLLASYLDSLQASSTEITNSLKTATSAAEIFATVGKGKDVKWIQGVSKDLGDLNPILDAAQEQSGNLFARFDSSHFGAFDALRDTGKQLGELAATDLPSAARAFNLLADATDKSPEHLQTLLDQMPDYKAALVEQATQLGINVTSTDEAANKQELLNLAMGRTVAPTEKAAEVSKSSAEKYNDSANAVNDLTNELDELVKAIDKANGVGQDAVTSNATYQDSLNDVKAAIANIDPVTGKAKDAADALSTSIDESTLAGSANAAMFSDLAKKGQDAITAQYNLDQQTMSSKDAADKYVASLNGNKQALYDQIYALTGNADAAQALTDKIYAIPDPKPLSARIDTATATAAIDAFIAKLNSIPGQRDVTINEVVKQTGRPQGEVGAAYNANGNIFGFAAGGLTERHVAQMARAGDMRVWAEPETGGEAYIPMAMSKRARSTALLSHVANEFGLDLTPRGAQRFADGGFTGTPAKSGGLTWTGDIVLQLPSGIDGPSISKLVRAEVNQIVRETR